MTHLRMKTVNHLSQPLSRPLLRGWTFPTSITFQNTCTHSILPVFETWETEAQAQHLAQLFHDYQDAFATSSEDLGHTNIVQHCIDTGDHPPLGFAVRVRSAGQKYGPTCHQRDHADVTEIVTLVQLSLLGQHVGVLALAGYKRRKSALTANPIKQPPRHIPIHKREFVHQEIQKMLQKGVLEPCDGPWSSPIVLVAKKGGETRFCVDFRLLNEVTKKDAYPLTRIEDNLDALQSAQWYSTLDLLSGFWQVYRGFPRGQGQGGLLYWWLRALEFYNYAVWSL